MEILLGRRERLDLIPEPAVHEAGERPQVQIQGGGSKVLQTRRHYKLANVDDGIATIEVTYQVLSPINSQIESQIYHRLMSGTVRFDIEAGRVVEQQMKADKRILGFAGPDNSPPRRATFSRRPMKSL